MDNLKTLRIIAGNIQSAADDAPKTLVSSAQLDEWADDLFRTADDIERADKTHTEHNRDKKVRETLKEIQSHLFQHLIFHHRSLYTDEASALIDELLGEQT